MKKTLTYLVLLMAGLLFSLTARAELVIRITDGVNDGVPLMIVPFQGSDLASIIEADLKRSGQFTLVPHTKAGQALALGQPFQQDRLRASGADYAVVGRQQAADGLEFEIINVATGQRAAGFRIPPHPNRRRMAHKAADLIFERLTGLQGAFDTRIAYVAASGPARRQTYRLLVSDADGYNPQTVMTSGKPVMSPSWSPDGMQLAYVSFETGQSGIYVQDLLTGGKRLVSMREGINGAPAWSPDGRYLAVSLSEGGNPDIYLIGVLDGSATQLTRSPAIDTEPTWANTNSIIYTSDRDGQPQLYRTTIRGGDGYRLTNEGRYNAAASIVGNSVAMVRQMNGRFRIAVMNASTRASTVVSKGDFDESPSLAPNGSMVLYATKLGGRGVLAVSSANGKARQILSEQAGDVRDPSWSPFLD
ncbi:MAG: Tol-Pal system beta propeller repeat protein TolB [Proteobacteria bacterium]|nr:MAG: Tol-Pal system beta propeller repeat protein TolB [Pseudomonadota bacterium]